MEFEDYLEDSNLSFYEYYRDLNRRQRLRLILRMTVAFLASLALIGAAVWMLANHLQHV